MSKTLKERILAVADAEKVSCNDVRGHLVDLAIKATVIEYEEELVREFGNAMIPFRSRMKKKYLGCE